MRLALCYRPFRLLKSVLLYAARRRSAVSPHAILMRYCATRYPAVQRAAKVRANAARIGERDAAPLRRLECDVCSLDAAAIWSVSLLATLRL